jgi:hypothetical protein
VVAPLAFAVSAITATPVGTGLMGLSTDWAAVVLAGGVLLIRAIDEAGAQVCHCR